ncbi:helix-turn-helix domain-containing protein [Catellatospora tritici]|uniref:helix-turn-helix domain-containing protein n=1 Tax=Catellatospora tritici TaxID=2851566 RepID=UPI001C2DAAFC|nr:helix-turn-helix domain-containing protein [Catellatospora tritici]MBV1849188.1 helix-turn-helix domain-containing protein [Catellatospora tritici]
MAKPELRTRAVELRLSGGSVPEIAKQLGVARSTAFQWVRHIPLDSDADAAERRRRHSQAMTDARWGSHRVETAQRRDAERAAGQALVGELTAHELALVGAVIFWCEGTKEKPWRANDGRVTVTNTDPRLLRIFIRFLESIGVSRSELIYRVSIHETADPAEAELWWAGQLDVPLSCFRRATLKRHKPTSTRHNQAEGYHGCLVVTARRRRELYWRIEGIIDEIDRRTGAAVAGEPR